MVSNSASNLDGFQYVYRSRAHGAPAASTNTNTRARSCKHCQRARRWYGCHGE